MARFYPRRVEAGDDYTSRILAVEEFLGRLGDLPTTLAAEAQAAGVPLPPPPPTPYAPLFGDLDDVTDNGVEGDLPVLISGEWTGQQWSPGVLGIGMSAATAYRFEAQDAVSGPTTLTYAAKATDTLVAYLTQLTTPNSGLRGLHLQKKSTSVLPLGITLEYDTGPLWDVCAVDATTTDLVQAFSHVLKADNWRMRADTAQYAIGRIVGQPALAGAQEQAVSGNLATITAITKAAAAVVTVGADHRFAVGEVVAFAGIVGMTAMNSATGTITAMGATTITTNIDSSGFGVYVSGGQAFVQMTGFSMTGYGNSIGLLLLQGVTGTRRTKIQYGLSGPQMGSDASQDNTNDWWLFIGSIFAMYGDATGHMFIGGTGSRPAPTAKLHLGAGTTAASSAPLKLSSGTSMTTAENGAIEYDGSEFYATPQAATRRILGYLPAVAAKSADYTLTAVDQTIVMDATGGNRIATLPAASAVSTGTTYDITKIDVSANTVTVTAAGADTINGAATQVITVQYANLTVRKISATAWMLV